jgi:hypothetical protein
MLDRWVDQYKRLGSNAFPNSAGRDSEPIGDEQRILELEALVSRITLENEFLKAVVKKQDQMRKDKQP